MIHIHRPIKSHTPPTNVTYTLPCVNGMEEEHRLLASIFFTNQQPLACLPHTFLIIKLNRAVSLQNGLANYLNPRDIHVCT